MKKNLLIILLVGLGITALLFQLPKGNVAGKTQNTPSGGANRDAGSEKTEKVAEKEVHAAPLTPAQLKEISALKSAFAAAKTDASQVKALENLMLERQTPTDLVPTGLIPTPSKVPEPQGQH